ncbi:MAG: HK97 family phage prohead protease [Chloroflexota bacterium]|nr:HK97 family phage prohead protease [Chloroflexota bacterium]
MSDKDASGLFSMPDTVANKFKITVPITGYTLRKSADGTEKYVITGMASNTHLDLTGERMAETAIAAMVKSLELKRITLNNEHGSDWDDDFGEVTKLWATDSQELMMEAELDPDHYRTKTLIKALDKGKKLGLSIGGAVKEAAMEWFADLGRRVMTYKNIDLFHVAITGTPAVAETWVTPITKSLKDWKDLSMIKEQPLLAKSDTAPAAPAPDATPAAPTPTPEGGTTPATPNASDQPQVNDALPASDAAVGDPTPDTPVETPAAGQEDNEAPADEPAAAKSAPDQAKPDTSEVAKSTVFGDWAEIGMATSAINDLSWTLSDYVWMTLVDEEKSAQDKTASIDAALSDFHTLIMKVVSALVADGNAEEIERAAKAFKAQSPEAVSKSLADRDSLLADLTKSLETKTAEVANVTQELATAQKALTDLQATAEASTKELETIKARKTVAFNEGARQAAVIDTQKAEPQPTNELPKRLHGVY